MTDAMKYRIQIVPKLDPLVDAYIKIFHIAWLRDQLIKIATEDGSPNSKSLAEIHANYLDLLESLKKNDENYSDDINKSAEEILSKEIDTYTFEAFMADTTVLYSAWLLEQVAPSKLVIITLIKTIMTYLRAMILSHHYLSGVITSAHTATNQRLEIMSEIRETIKAIKTQE